MALRALRARMDPQEARCAPSDVPAVSQPLLESPASVPEKTGTGIVISTMPMHHYILNAAGDPVPCDDLLTWAQWFETVDNRRIAQDRNEGPGSPDVRVSTVFLGLDHQWGNGPPVLWETMVFGGPHDGLQERYTSRAAALQGHQDICRQVLGGSP